MCAAQDGRRQVTGNELQMEKKLHIGTLAVFDQLQVFFGPSVGYLVAGSGPEGHCNGCALGPGGRLTAPCPAPGLSPPPAPSRKLLVGQKWVFPVGATAGIQGSVEGGVPVTQ